MKNIESLASSFRKAIEEAKAANEFTHDFAFHSFPLGCCEDTCDLLGQYLLSKGIQTRKMCGEWYSENCEWKTHVWLTINEGTIIDLTGDQFKEDPKMLNYDIPVYIGQPNAFHGLFQITKSQESRPFHMLGSFFDHSRLPRLYDAILKYIEEA